MARIIDEDEDFMDELVGLDDYDVIPRPQELIEQQTRSSSSKLKLTADKSASSVPKRSSEAKHLSKSKEKRSSSKHERKSSKAKPLYKPPFSESSSKYIPDDLNKKFESFVQNVKSSIYKYKSESSKMAGNESSDLAGSKSKQSDIDTNKYLVDIQHPRIMEPAVTALQRYQVLDARDIAIRSKESKQGDSKKTKIIGNCPDMCPEKERYSRIAKNCLSALEMTAALDPNTTLRDANHCYMVKEYSRSSADQQEPLSHELRPIPVLIFTMDYLICNIMDLPLDNISLSDWYDFIWNRTRSIRKDITQQQLCDIQCVEIIEKCVRFHVHCAEALSEEETAIFDPKINNENLTKCLQTLKHMYHDLQSKGIHCPNEAEFKSYDILLSLTEGETLRLIKDIRVDLLKSPLIKSAFNAALTFKSHNYVKFFKIIEKANYLSSCILHRYILEARVRALQIIVRAYSTQHNATLYPTLSLVKDLKFENSAEACEFCRCHGLEANETYLTIERKQFSKYASGLPSSRSFLLVGSKRGTSLGKIINNGELPANPLDWYQPHDSFDENNVLKIDSLCSNTKINEIEEIDLMEQESMDIPLTDDDPQHLDSATATILDFKKSTKSKFEIKDANINELEKAKSYLLSRIMKLQSYNAEKLEEKKSELSITSGKIKTKKSSNSVKEKTLKSHRSSRFPSEDSNSLQQKPDLLRTSSQHDVLPSANLDSSENVLSQKDTPLSKFHKLSSPSHFGNLLDVPEPFQKTTSPEHVTSTSAFKKPKTPQSTSAFNFLSSETNENFSLFFGPTHPPASSNVTLRDKGDDPLTSPSKEYTFLHSQPAFKNRAVLEFHRTEALSLSGISSPHSAISGSVLKFPGTNEIILPSRKSSIDVEKEVEYPEINIEEEIRIEDSEVSKSSNEGLMLEINELNEKERQENELNEILEDIVDKLCSECVQEYSISICEEVLNDERTRKAKIEDELEIIRTNLAMKTILKWKLFCERRCQRRVLQNSTLCSPLQAMLINTPYVKTGVVSPMVVYKKHCSLSRLTAEKMNKRNEITPGWEEFKTEEIWPLKAFRPYSSAYFGRSGIKFFFKLCIVFPADCYNSDVAVFMDWICAKFSLCKTQNYKFDAMNTFILHNGKALISVRAFKLVPQASSNYPKILDGITAMILFFPHALEDNNAFYNDFASLLDSDTLQYPYPLFTYFMQSQQKSTRLTSFLHEKLDSRYFTQLKTECLPEIKHFVKNSKKVSEALTWLLETGKKEFLHPWLHKCSFRNYLEDSFTFAFNILLCKISLDEFKCLKQMPHHIINFYNKVLEFRSSVLCSDLLERIHSSWPPEEVKLHSDDKFIDVKVQNQCKEKMKFLLLPNIEGESLSNHIWDYVKRVGAFACRDRDVLFIRVKNALENSNSSDDWLTVINMCALHLIHAQNSELSLLAEDLPVYYTKEDLETFDCDEFWMDVLSDIRYSTLNYTKRKNDSMLEFPLKKKKWDFCPKEISLSENVPLQKEKSFISNAFDMPDIFSFQRENLFAPLKSAFAEQAEQSDAFIHRLNESIQITDDPKAAFDYSSEETDIINKEIPSAVEAEENSLVFSVASRLNSSTPDLDLLGISVNNSSETTFFSLADKISELKYNIQKNNILEEHFSQLLSKQL